MGSGKTYIIYMLLRILHEWSSISVTCRCSLALNQQGELNRSRTKEEEQKLTDVVNQNQQTLLLSGNDFKHYKDKKIKGAKRLICELESLKHHKDHSIW